MWLHYALAASILWGLDYTLNGRLLEYIQPQTLMLIQLGLGFLVYFIFVVFFQPKIQLSVDLEWLLKNKAFFGLVILTVSTYLIADFCIFQSIRFKNPAIAAMIETSYPVFTLFFCFLLFKQNFLNLKSCVGAGLIVLGVTILSYT
jgi:drug/metabolite transporter (DMT)-like permease